MNTVSKIDATIENLEPSCKQPPTETPATVDVKQTLNLRHQTALAWVMPEYWEPMHN